VIVFVTLRFVKLEDVALKDVKAPVDGVIFPTGVLFSAVIVILTPEIEPPVILTLGLDKVVKLPVDGVVAPIGVLLIVLVKIEALEIMSDERGGEKNSPPGPTNPTHTPLTSNIA